MEEQLTLDALRQPTPLLKEETSSKSLWEIIENYEEEVWVVPEFQRELVWNEKKRKSFGDVMINYSETTSPAEGTILLCQIEVAKTHPIYILDGRQRIETLVEMKNVPRKWNILDGDMVLRLKRTNYPIRVIFYKTLDEAISAFQRINKGTSLTPKEFYKGVLCSLPNHGMVEKKLDGMTNDITEIIKQVTSKKTWKRITQHKYIRWCYALLHLWMGKDKQRAFINPRSIRSGENQTYTEDKSQIEYLLKEVIETTDDWEDKVDRFVKRIKWYTEDIKAYWQEYRKKAKPQRYAIVPSILQILWQLYVWKENNKLLEGRWKEIVNTLFEKTNGSQWIGNGEEQMNISKITTLNLLMDILELDSSLAPSRRKKKEQLPVGLEHGHKTPFAIDGNNETIIEPAIRNRERGMKPMDAAEQELDI